jgi:hypothetical protein
MNVLTNYVNADIDYQSNPADYIELDLVRDYLIWTAGNTIVKDLATHEPSSSELSAAATTIDDTLPTTIPLCLLMDYSHDVGGAYYTHKIMGVGENKRYVLAFSFDGPTATEPQLEAWDDDTHLTIAKNVLGLGTALNSMVKVVCTTLLTPGAGWVGVPLAGSSNVLLLNGGNGALVDLLTGETSQELYCNAKIVIPVGYATPSAETFTLTIRYTYS